MKKEQYIDLTQKAREFYKKAGIVIAEDEEIEATDFNLGKAEKIGLQLCVYVNTARVCAKEMVLFPYQTCPEHKHVGTDRKAGKEETFRCRHGEVFLYVEGETSSDNIVAKLPETDTTVYREIILKPGQQYTIMPNTKHWFQGGPNGAIVSEFSTTSTDETDVFTDRRIIRNTIIEE